LIVFGAGTLANPFAQEIAAFKARHPGITVHSEFGASGDRVKAITQLGEPADVLGVADYSLIPKEMFGSGSKQFAIWYVGFVSNQITFAYTTHSKGAGQLTSKNWYRVLAQPGVHIGRSNPAADPSGYQILQMLKLAEGYYHNPSISATVLKNSPAASVAETETSLIGALQSGQLDYLAIYRSDALQHHFKYINLPPRISLSNPALAKTYATVSTQGATSASVKAKPIIYGLTVPTTAPDRQLGEQFVAFVLSPQGQAIMRANGFVVISPALASDQTALPASLRPLTRSWPGG
jgi:molybdate/tungstate transport system substrate-binding protein